MKLYLGCGPLPIHQQHLDVMGDMKEWTLVDYFVNHPKIQRWDATKLYQVPENSCEEIYASHLLEHLPHTEIETILKLWHGKLTEGGKLTVNVPDLAWAAKQLLKLDQGGLLDGYYYKMDGEHGLLSIFYGSLSHDGEIHKGGFIEPYLRELLTKVGFKEINIERKVEAHDMGCLIATCLR